MKKKEKILIFTGAGISAESGIETFRSETGLWNNHNVMDVCHPSGWQRDTNAVLDFYNERREDIRLAEPNVAHKAIVELEKFYDVVVVTQNIDDLHERAGSSEVIHLHGEITKVRSVGTDKIYDNGYKKTMLGDKCEMNFQLRPHIVWFTENPFNYDVAINHFRTADKVLIIGTSLNVNPAASLPLYSNVAKEKIIVSKDYPNIPHGYEFKQGLASELIPNIVNDWIN